MILVRSIPIIEQREGLRPERGIAPGAGFERNRRGLALRVGLELPDLRPCRIRAPIPLFAEDIGRRRLPYPEPEVVDQSLGPLPHFELDEYDAALAKYRASEAFALRLKRAADRFLRRP